MFKPLAAALAAGAFAVSGISAQQIQLVNADAAPTITAPKAGISMDLSAIDKTVNPCDDFYAYACGNWKKNNPIPADKTRYGRFDELGERNRYTLYTLLEQAANNPKTPLQVKYGNYYAACMNQPLADQLGAKPLQPGLARIAAVTDKKQIAKLNGEMESADGVGFFYGFGSGQDQQDSTKVIPQLGQGGLALPDRDYYLKDEARSKDIRGKYVDHVQKMFVLLGDTPEQAKTEADAVMKIETALAEGQMPRVEMRDPAKRYHLMTLTQLQQLTPDFQWNDYFAALHRPVTSLNVSSPKFVQALNAEIDAASLDELKSYMRWHLLNAGANALSQPFIDENFAFNGKVLTGQQVLAPLWRRCTMQTDAALGEAVGQDWVNANFPPAAKQNMSVLVADLEKALGQDIQGLDWMSDATKAQAQVKLAAFRNKIGYPETWRDYSKLDVKRDDRFGNARRTAVFSQNRTLDKIGKPVDEKEWSMSPPTVNAYYNPGMNDINFPAGILQPPFYDFKIDPAVNFGAIGVVIGHEMTHGFDDQGSKYDAQGNVKSWWTAEDRAKFEQRTDCEAKEFDAFEPVPGVHLNGKLTLGENTADNGGLHVAYAALHTELAKTPGAESRKIDGYTQDQRYFLGYAQVWCENTRPEAAEVAAKTDPHSPGRFRVNGEVQNFDKFGEAWGCKKGDPMFPVNSCRVW
ncbi:M13 family metallopeptidase [Terriglobus aquaticus]|uniref:M13 family metallopeptidase n=1 Tax=Terriglobus aquaticus TaxID=940139 RepID=A0ABW9KHL1_9BACT|nr:M13 family metallopeptidase [Terriglobus aquaticus]